MQTRRHSLALGTILVALSGCGGSDKGAATTATNTATATASLGGGSASTAPATHSVTSTASATSVSTVATTGSTMSTGTTTSSNISTVATTGSTIFTGATTSTNISTVATTGSTISTGATTSSNISTGATTSTNISTVATTGSATGTTTKSGSSTGATTSSASSTATRTTSATGTTTSGTTGTCNYPDCASKLFADCVPDACVGTCVQQQGYMCGATACPTPLTTVPTGMTSNTCYGNGVKVLTTIDMTNTTSMTAVTVVKKNNVVCYSYEMPYSTASTTGVTMILKDASGATVGTYVIDSTARTATITCTGASPVVVSLDCVSGQSETPACPACTTGTCAQ